MYVGMEVWRHGCMYARIIYISRHVLSNAISFTMLFNYCIHVHPKSPVCFIFKFNKGYNVIYKKQLT